MLRFVRRVGGGMIGFCAGEAGSFTRVLGPIFGSPFTYAAPAVLDGRAEPEPTAPGQLRVNDLRAALPPTGLTPETAILGVVGNPVRHSFSPWVHGMALKAAKLDAVYVAFEPDDFDAFLDLADDENFRGFSITAPFKQAAFRRASSSDQAGRRAGAVNTLVRDGSRWIGGNTDAGAVGETLETAFRHHGNVTGRPVALPVAHTLVLGTGGAARSAASAVRDREGRVTIAGRDPARAEALAREVGCAWIPWAKIAETDHDCLVNATPVGSLAAPGELPIDADWIRPGTLVLDCVYRPIRTPLLLAAKERGCTVIPGGEWFVRQAREQFRLFTHTEADDALMRAAFETAVREDA
jgi:shikimate dehydrogenase